MHARRRGCCTCPVLALSCPSVITVQITLVLAVFPICCRQHMFKIIRKLMPTSEDIYISLITWLLRSHNWHQYNQKCTGGASIYGCSRILSAVLRDTKHACMSLIVLLESPDLMHGILANRMQKTSSWTPRVIPYEPARRLPSSTRSICSKFLPCSTTLPRSIPHS